MKTLTAQTAAASTRRYAQPVYLLELTLYRDQFGASPTSTILRLADRVRIELGQTWLPLVKDWGSIGDALESLEPGGSIGALDVTLANTMRIDTPAFSVARFSDLIRAGLNGGPNTWDVAFAEATLYLLFKGGTTGDQLDLFALRCEEVTDLTEATCVLRMTGRELSLEDREDLYRISTVDFPLADPDVVGEPIPYPIGLVTEVPGLPIVAGIVHKLAGDITATVPPTGGALAVSDPDLVARMPTSGTLQLDDEQVVYTGRNIPGMTFTGITRGAFGTVATAHNKGTTVFQVLAEYIVAFGANVAAHLTQAVPRLRSDGALLVPSSYTLQLDNTVLKPGRRLVVARFPVLPVIKKQVQLVVQDTIGVIDQIGVSDQIGVAENIGVTDSIGVSSPSSETIIMTPTTTLPKTLLAVTHTGQGPAFQQVAFNVSFPPLPPGGAIQQIFYELDGTIGTGDSFGAPWNVSIEIKAPAVGPSPGFSLLLWNSFHPFITPDVQFNLAQYASLVVVMTTFGGPPNGSFTVRPSYALSKCTATIRRTLVVNKTGTVTKGGTASKTGAATKVGLTFKVGTVALSGNSSADTVLGHITADVEGWRDTAGNVTALTGGPGPSALIANPADVTYALMREVFGETNAARYHATRWATTRTRLASAGYQWSFLYRGGSWSEFRKLAGLQARSDLFQEGGRYVFVYRELAATAHTFTKRNTVGPPVIGWTPRTDLVTVLSVTYDPHPDTDVWRGTLEKRSTQAASRYGPRRRLDRRTGARDLPLPWVRHAPTADAAATYWLGQWEVPRMTVALRGLWDALALDKADIIDVDAADFPVLTPYGAIGFGVRRKRYRLSEGLLEIEAVELDRLPSELARAAAYFIADTMSRTLPSEVRVIVIRDLTRPGAYRVLTVPELTRAAQYFLGMESSPAKAGQYFVHATLDRVLAAAYVLATAWDTGLQWDTPGILWDGAALPPLLAWDFLPTPFVWDDAARRWDN